MSESDLQAPDNLQTPHVCEGGNLDCGSGLLLLIRRAVNQMPEGDILEIRSTEISVREDFPAWCRMTKNSYLGWRQGNDHQKYFVQKGKSGKKMDEYDEHARNYRWQTRIHWNGGMQAKVFCRNHSWTVGQPASFDVKDNAPSAVEYLLGAMGACLAMGFQIHASRRNIHIDELEITLSGQIENIFVFLGVERSGHSGFREITGRIYVQSDADEKALGQIWQETITASPVVNTLTHRANMNISMTVV
ncbi:MAG: osmotically inducible protein OsmC [Candidatus Brocadia sp.]|nr:MAG: osmotically inducible protein OsmC [Candidatus Brocadia sp.]